MKLVELVNRYLDHPAQSPVLEPDDAPTKVFKPALCVESDLSANHQCDLSPTLDQWPMEWREIFEERAGIMEFDGGLSRAKAEKAAEACIRESFKWQQEVEKR